MTYTINYKLKSQLEKMKQTIKNREQLPNPFNFSRISLFVPFFFFGAQKIYLLDEHSKRMCNMETTREVETVWSVSWKLWW